LTSYPWAVSGRYVAAVTGIPSPAADRRPAEGVAYAFLPGGRYIRLGRAVAVYAASQPGRFWIRTASFRGRTAAARPHQCAMTEMSASGRRIAGPVAVPCARWMVAAVPGGFVSVPTTTANAARFPAVRTWEFGLGGGQLSPEIPVQLWNPLTGKVVRTYHIDPGWIYGAAGQYVAWRPRSAALHVTGLDLTNLATGVTRRVALPVSPGDSTWRDPVLAPHGPYLAWMEVAKASLRTFTAGLTISGTDGAPADPGPGRVKVLDFATGRVLLDRATTIATAGAFDWAPDNRYLFVTTGYTSLDVMPTWSATAPIRHLQLLGEITGIPNTEQIIVTLRTPPAR
jgi:hypothetical protein